MKALRYLIIIFFIFVIFKGSIFAEKLLVKVNLIQKREVYEPGRIYPIKIQLKIPDSWYIHSTEKQSKGLIPTTIKFYPADGINVKNLRFPSPQKIRFPYFNEPLDLYSGEIFINGELELSPGISPGIYSLNGELIYQACKKDSCIPPEKVPIRFNIQVGEGKKKDKGIVLTQKGRPSIPSGWKLFFTLSGIFLAGLGLNLTPCIYPLIPITVSYFGIRSGKGRTKIILHAITYIIGIALTNSTLGTFVALSGGMLGEWLQSPWVLAGVSSVLFIFGLSSLGLWEIRLPSGLMGALSWSYEGYVGTLFMGLTLGVVSAPCIGPFILGLLTYVGTLGSPFLGFLFFFTLSLGMGIPLAIIGIFSGLMNRMPLSGEWMVWIRKLMGWVLILMGVHVISPIIPLIKDGWLPVIISGIIACIHLGWLDRSGDDIKRFIVFKRLFLISGLLGGAILILFQFYTISSQINWIPYQEKLLEQAKIMGKPVIIDFYADWCTPCISIEKEIFHDKEVINSMKGILPLRVDLTSRRPDQQKILKRFKVKGVPTIIFIGPDGEELKELRITSYVDKNTFLNKLTQLFCRYSRTE